MAPHREELADILQDDDVHAPLEDVISDILEFESNKDLLIVLDGVCGPYGLTHSCR